jgi:hypothetical protein
MFRNHRVDEVMRVETDVAKAVARDELRALKALLFAPEMHRLTQAEERVGALDRKLGASEGFEKAVAEIMARALVRASGDHPRDMARALGPSLTMALAHEARVSRDSLVEALRPAAPALVRSARWSWFQRVDNGVARLLGSRGQGLGADLQLRPGAPISLRIAQIAAVVAIAALVFYGWRTGVRMQHDHSMAAAVSAFMTANPEAAIAPLGIVTDHVAGKVDVQLLAGSAADLKAFSAALEAAAGPHYRVVTRVAFTALQSGFAKLRDTQPAGAAPVGVVP